MDSKKIIWQETGIVAAGVLLCSALMTGTFAILGKFDFSVALGTAVGTLLAVGNFLFMALGVTLAADRAVKQDVTEGRLLIRNSYLIRLPVLAVLLFVCGRSGVFNLFALVLPLTFVRPVLIFAGFLRKTGGTQSCM